MNMRKIPVSKATVVQDSASKGGRQSPRAGRSARKKAASEESSEESEATIRRSGRAGKRRVIDDSQSQSTGKRSARKNAAVEDESDGEREVQALFPLGSVSRRLSAVEEGEEHSLMNDDSSESYCGVEYKAGWEKEESPTQRDEVVENSEPAADNEEVDGGGGTGDAHGDGGEQQEAPTAETQDDGDDWEMATKIVYDPDDRVENDLPLEVPGMYEVLIEQGGKTSRATSLQNTYVKNVFVMLACYVMDEIGKEAPVTNADKYMVAEERFQNMLRLLPKREYEKVSYFNFHNNTWPPCFLSYVNDLYDLGENGKPSAGLKWANAQGRKIKNLTEKEKMRCYVGHKICEEFTSAKSSINMHCYRAWMENFPPKSGFEIEALFRAVRRSLWRPEAYRRAKISLRAAARRNNTTIDLVEEEALVRAKALEVLKEMNLEWYPDFWLAFAVYSAPAGENSLTSLRGGTDPTINPLGTASQAARSLQAALASTEPSAPTAVGGSGPSFQSPNQIIREAGAQSKKYVLSKAARTAQERMQRNDKAIEDGSTLTTEPPRVRELHFKHTFTVNQGTYAPDRASKLAQQIQLTQDILGMWEKQGNDEMIQQTQMELLDLMYKARKLAKEDEEKDYAAAYAASGSGSGGGGGSGSGAAQGDTGNGSGTAMDFADV